MDITAIWTESQGIHGIVSSKNDYTINGKTYTVDGKHVFHRYSNYERQIAEILAIRYGKTVDLVPSIVFPQKIQTPDYLIDGKRFDLKTPQGQSANLLYNQVAKKRGQASNFIFDLTKCPLSDDEIERQVQGIYASHHTRFINKVVLMRNGIILKVYKRN